jgi:hypothetical protein
VSVASDTKIPLLPVGLLLEGGFTRFPRRLFVAEREERTGEAEVTGTDELESPWMCEFAAGSFIRSLSLQSLFSSLLFDMALRLILRSRYVTLQLLAIFVWQPSLVVQHIETHWSQLAGDRFFFKKKLAGHCARQLGASDSGYTCRSLSGRCVVLFVRFAGNSPRS